MSFLQFFRIFWARRMIVVATTLATLAAGLLAIWIIPERYEAETRVMMDLVKPDPVTGEVISTNFARAYTKTQTELVTDYRVAGAVVDALGWANSPELLARYNAEAANSKLDFRRWLAQIVIDGTKANAIEGSNILEIAYSSTNPETARTMADAVRNAYVQQSIAFKREDAAQSADYFERQVARVRDQLTAAEARKAAFERQNRIVLQDDLSDVESTRLRALAGQSPSPVGAAAGAASPAALQLAQIDAQIATAAKTLGPNHPEIQSLRQQRAALAQAAAQERAALQPSGGGGPSIAGQVNAQESKVLAQRDKLEVARRLAADVTVLRDQYAKTAARAVDLRQQADSNLSGLTLLGSAVAPSTPVFPNVPLILIGSIGLGFGLGVLVSLVTELLSRRVRGVEDLSYAGVPVLMVVNGRNTAPSGSRLSRLGWSGAGRA